MSEFAKTIKVNLITLQNTMNGFDLSWLTYVLINLEKLTYISLPFRDLISESMLKTIKILIELRKNKNNLK